MRWFLTYCFVIASSFGIGQTFSSEVFHQGFMVSSDKDTLSGDLKYDLEANVITLVNKGKTKSFSSQKVFYFEIFDAIFNVHRQFYSIPYNVKYDYKIPVFFEVVYEGKLSLLRREQVVTQTVNTNSIYGGVTTIQNVMKYSYFFLDDQGEITYFTGKKKDLFRFMSDKQTDLKQFINQNKLNTDEMADLIRITAFYNSI